MIFGVNLVVQPPYFFPTSKEDCVEEDGCKTKFTTDYAIGMAYNAAFVLAGKYNCHLQLKEAKICTKD